MLQVLVLQVLVLKVRALQVRVLQVRVLQVLVLKVLVLQVRVPTLSVRKMLPVPKARRSAPLAPIGTFRTVGTSTSSTHLHL